MRYLLEIEIATEKIKSLRQEQAACKYKGKKFENWYKKLQKAIAELETVLAKKDDELKNIKELYDSPSPQRIS